MPAAFGLSVPDRAWEGSLGEQDKHIILMFLLTDGLLLTVELPN